VPLDQSNTPLFDALRTYGQIVKSPLHVPGHKMGQWVGQDWYNHLGPSALAMDLTESVGLDDLHAANGVIAQSQRLSSEAFGAGESHFLVGGSTSGLHALILAAAAPGQRVLVPRHSHRSVVGALILSGATPEWVRPRFHDYLDLVVDVDHDSFAQGLAKVNLVVSLYPTYHGFTGSLQVQIEMAHSAGIPVIVDEAHGSHFAFHPRLPRTALELGADAVVHSLHKTGGSLTQSSICHLSRTSRISGDRVRDMLRLVQTTSPSYLLMASLDVARRELVMNGAEAWQKSMSLRESTISRISAVKGIRVEPVDDPSKLLIDVRGRRLTGFQAAEHLWSYGVAIEACGLTYLLAVVSPGDSDTSMDYLIRALHTLPEGLNSPYPALAEAPWPQTVVSPRDAYLSKKESVLLIRAAGRIAAEMVAPYPPGIPVVVPGERLSKDVIGYLQQVASAGHRLQGPADATLSKIQVMKE
jgi:arginine decarboxylase